MLPHFINPRPAPADNDAGPGGVQSDSYFFSLAVYFYQGNTGFRVFVFNVFPELMVFLDILGIVRFTIPMGLPVFNDAQSEPCRVNFMTQLTLLLSNYHGNVAGILMYRACSPPRPRPETAHTARNIDINFNYLKVGGVHLKVVFGVGHGRLHHLGDKSC